MGVIGTDSPGYSTLHQVGEQSEQNGNEDAYCGRVHALDTLRFDESSDAMAMTAFACSILSPDGSDAYSQARGAIIEASDLTEEFLPKIPVSVLRIMLTASRRRCEKSQAKNRPATPR